MAGHGGVSETANGWVTDEGLASRRWLKVQSGHTVMGVEYTVSTRAGESIQVHYEGLGLAGYFPDKIYLHIRSTSKLELRTSSARLLD